MCVLIKREDPFLWHFLERFCVKNEYLFESPTLTSIIVLKTVLLHF